MTKTQLQVETSTEQMYRIDKYVDKIGIKRVDIDRSQTSPRNKYMTIHRENSYIIKGVDKKRIKSADKNRGREGARVYIGFGIWQPSSVKEKINGKTKKNPTLLKDGDKFLNNISNNLKSALGDTSEYFSNWDESNKGTKLNEERTILCNKYFVEKYWPGKVIKFEFVDISMLTRVNAN
jgi:hypothetical protein